MTGPQQPPPGGQWPGGGGGDWQPPSEQTHYNVSPPSSGQPYDPYGQPASGPPGYDQYGQPVTGQPYDQYGQQQYDQYGQPVTGQPYDQYGQPGYPPPGAPMPPPKKKSSPLPWILGGVAVVVVIAVLCVVGIVVWANSGSKGGSHGGSVTGSSSSGKYKAQSGANLCDSVDSSSVTTANPSASVAGQAKHNTDVNSYASMLDCDMSWSAPESSSSYSSSSLGVNAEYSSSESSAKSSYDSSKKSAAGQSGTGHSYGAESGIGADSFYEADTDSDSAEYKITALDSNVVLEVQVRLSQDGITVDKAKAAAEAIAKSTLAKLGGK